MKNSIIRYAPTSNSLFRDEFITSMDNIFNNIFQDMFPDTSREFGMDMFTKGAYPKVNVVDENTQIVIEAEIPGLSKDNVTVEVENGVLTIKGEKNESNNSQDNKKYLYRELKRSSFVRSFKLNDNLDATKIDAKFENGMLEVKLPKKIPTQEEKKVMKVTIK